MYLWTQLVQTFILSKQLAIYEVYLCIRIEGIQKGTPGVYTVLGDTMWSDNPDEEGFKLLSISIKQII